MNELATIFRFAQFYAHIAHNLASGQTFFQDHEFLGELYGAYESAYDDVVERMIGLGQTPDLKKINLSAATLLNAYGSDYSTEACLRHLLYTEKEICEEVAKIAPTTSDGTQNLLQGLADDSEKRQYKLGQRLKK